MSRSAIASAVALVALASWSLAGAASQTAPSHAASHATVQGLTLETTGVCHDGSLSTAQHSKGACSGHGGVKTWFGTAPKDATARCKDGTFSKSTSSKGACSSHGGVAFDLKHKA